VLVLVAVKVLMSLVMILVEDAELVASAGRIVFVHLVG
jgi:hypothetical protein